MTTPINLNKFRKAKKRTAAKKIAAENRVKYGESKAEKTLRQARAEKLRAASEQAKLTPPEDGA